MADDSVGKKRGRYKLYNLLPDDEEYNPVVPKTTKWRRFQVSNLNHSLTAESNTHFIPDSVSDEEGDRYTGIFNIQEEPAEEEEEEYGLFGNTTDRNLENNADDVFSFFEQEQENSRQNCEMSEEDISDHQSDVNQPSESGQPEPFDEPLYENAPVTVGQCLLLLMAFILGNKLAGVVVVELLKLLTLILPSSSRLPKTKFLFYKYFDIFKDGLQFKLFCPQCKSLFDTADTMQCSICEREYEKKNLLKEGSFFIYLPLEKQLQELFERQGAALDLDYRFTRAKVASDTIEDILDGQMYKSVANGALTNDPNAMSISFSCDGVPIFRSSGFSIWPLQGILNELPPQQRKENIFLIGLWFGIGKPCIAQFLEPFTQELQKLSTFGMKWLRNGQEVCSRVFACIYSCDSVARCAIQNIHQFNGAYGCSWCYNPGKTIEKGRGHARVYLDVPGGYDLRNHEQMSADALEAYTTQKPLHGVKGPSKLFDLPNFDVARGFVVDNLHCVDFGVSRQLAHLWFDSTHHQQPWYIGRKLKDIDSRLSCIMPPHEITRVPRSITQRSYWKASEWHWWLLLYCPVVLHGVLPPQYFRHILLLVEAVYLLTKSCITRNDINKADACLSKFVTSFQQLYGDANMSYNVHQLSHLTQTVVDWGPLSGFSTYIFEGFNQVLLKLFHGTQAVPSQIAKSFLLYRAMKRISNHSCDHDSVNVFLSFMDAQLKGHTSLKKARRVGDKTVLLGASYFRQLSVEERYLLQCYYNGDDVSDEDCDAEFFTKAVVNGNLFHCLNYTRDSRRKNYIVGLRNGTTVELIVFALIGNTTCIAFARLIKLERYWLYPDNECGHLCNHIQKVVEVESALEIVVLTDIVDKYALIDGLNDDTCTFIAKLPNVVDRD